MKIIKETYEASSYETHTSGDRVELKCFLSLTEKDTEEIESIIQENSLESIESLMKSAKEREEQFIKTILEKLSSEWSALTYQTKLYEKAIDTYKALKSTVEHSNNQWEIVDKGSWWYREEISNATYRMVVRINENQKYNSTTKEQEAISWYVSWNLYTNSPINHEVRIAGQDRKLFTDKEKALKYVEGRKKAYEDYFTEEYPLVPEEYKHVFEHNGILLPNYTVEVNQPTISL